MDTFLCAECRQSISNEPRPLAVAGIDGGWAATAFGGVIRAAIHALKYDGQTALAATLTTLMVPAWRTIPFPVDFLLPVPLYPGRLRERGYNQAALLAGELARQIDLPVHQQALIRSRKTESQVKLTIAGRHRNVAGAFTARPDVVSGHAVLLIDDVCTTGATLGACACALQEAGVVKVFAITLAEAAWDPATGTAADAAP